MEYNYVLKTAPTIEPVTLSEVLTHLNNNNSSSYSNDLVQSIAPGSHNVAADYSLVGTGIDVSGYSAQVIFESGTNGAGGKVDVKIQESDDNITYTDWTGGAFTQVTTANDNTTYEKSYTGTKQYIRVVATVAVAACEFGVSILKYSPISEEGVMLESLITVARDWCEMYHKQVYITQTWELWLDNWPFGDVIELQKPPLQAVNSIKYYGTDNTEYTLAATEYQVGTKSKPGRVSLAKYKSWPTTILRPIEGIFIEFDAGYGDAASDVPKRIKQAILLIVGHLDAHREETTEKVLNEIPLGAKALLGIDRPPSV